MNRTSYSFAIFITALAFFITVVYGLFYFQLGRPLFTMQSFGSWFLLTAAINTVAAIVILQYLNYQKYRFALITGIIATITQLGLAYLVYGMMMGMDLTAYYITTYMASLAAGVVYGFGLALPPAGKRVWLLSAGILTAIISSIVLVAIGSFRMEALTFAEVERVSQWASLASMFIPGLFLMNFVRELNALKRARTERPSSKSVEVIMVIGAVLAGIVTLGVTAKFAFEGMGAIAWHRQAPERIKALAEPFEARTFVSKKDRGTLLYRFMSPPDYDTTKQYPLVVCLHHGGTHGNDNMKQIDGSPIAQLLTSGENRRKYPAFLFVPQCPEGTGWGGIKELPSIDSLVFEALQAFGEEFSVDRKRVYVAGTSGGGYGSWHFICSRPEMFAAAIPVCGGTDPSLANRIVDVPVWAFHGAQDRNVPVRHSRDMIEAIKKAGGDPKYTEFPEQAHNIWPQVNATPGLLDWLFAQQRE